MDDLISRQAAIDALESDIRMAKSEDGELWVAKINAQLKLTMLPSVTPKQRWIPCGERLPEYSGFYIVTRKDFLVGYMWYSVFHGWEWQEKGQPIAWLPLPEPYREEGGDK